MLMMVLFIGFSVKLLLMVGVFVNVNFRLLNVILLLVFGVIVKVVLLVRWVICY